MSNLETGKVEKAHGWSRSLRRGRKMHLIPIQSLTPGKSDKNFDTVTELSSNLEFTQ